MNPEHSPFTPNRPAGTDLFTGRMPQIETLRSSILRAARGELQVCWISGERGIGKSSLASLVGLLVERDEHALVAHVHLGGIDTLEGMVRKTILSLLEENQSKSWGGALWDLFRDKVTKVGILGMELQLDLPDEGLTAAVRNFAKSLKQIIDKAGADRKVLLLIFDDINGLADKPGFAHWLKSTVDGAATSRLNVPACLVFVGLEERLDTMRGHNPSVGRSFWPLMRIDPWQQKESEEFFRKAFDSRAINIEGDSVEMLARYSGGLPTIAHEIGYFAWQNATGDTIKKDDCFTGIIGAADSIGNRFIEKDVIQMLKSERYHSILGKLAAYGFDKVEFSIQEFRALATLTPEEKQALNNFLRRLVKLGGVVRVAGGKGGRYRFPTHMHRIYFMWKSDSLLQKGGS